MVNKTRLTSLVLGVLAATALAACGGTGGSSAAASSSAASSSTPTSSSPASSTSVPASSSSTPVVNIPTKADHYTFYFHFKAREDGVKSLESWTSPYIDGVFNDWDAHPGVEMTALEGTDIYYAFVAKADANWATNKNDLGYQLCLGYNASSGVGASMQGIAGYTYKSDFSTLFSGTSHPVWATSGTDEPTDNSLVDLRAYQFGADSHVWTGDGDDFMTFAAQPTKPEILANYTLAFDVSGLTDVPTQVSGYMIKGSFNGWESKALTQDTTNKNLYTVTIDQVIAGAKLSFCVAPVTAAIHEVKDEYFLTGDGVHDADEMSTTDATKIVKPGNLTLTPLKIDGDNYTNTWGKLATYDGYDWPAAPVAMTDDVTLTFTNSNANDAVMPAAITSVRLVGEVTNWTATDVANEMTKSSDGKSYTFTISAAKMYIGVIYNFKIVANGDWAGAVCGNAASDANMTFEAAAKKVHLDVSSDWSLFGTTKADGTVNYYGDVINGVTIAFKNSGTAAMSADVTSVSLVGTLTNWDQAATANDMTKAADGSYTFALPDNTMYAGTGYELKIVFNHLWANAIGSGAGDMAFTAVKDQPVVTISADFALCFVGPCDGVVTSAAAA